MNWKMKTEYLKRSEVQLLKLKKDRDLLESELIDFKKQKEWIDWMKITQKRLSQKGERTEEEKHQFIRTIIDRIDVKIIDKKNHLINIHYLIPIVKERYINKKTKNDGRKSYFNLNGTNNLDGRSQRNPFHYGGIIHM